jgi:hypothetical protein
MKNLTRALVSALILSVTVPVATGVEQQEQEQIKLRLELVYIFEADPTEFLLVIGNSGFRSVPSLKKFIAGLPRGTTLEWAPGCKRMGNEPLLSSEEEMDEFKMFCEERGIRFLLIPSG